MNILLILLGKLIRLLSSSLGLGSGSTWPGHIALSLNKNFIRGVLTTNDQRPKTILIAGTNGKTTTGKLIQTILENNEKKVFQNQAGANLLNGIASALIQYSTKLGRLNYDYAIFEVDENTLPLALTEFTPDFLILLNLFRDQLDRYGEVNIVASKWKKAIEQLNNPASGGAGQTILILNADDPQIAYLSKSRKQKVFYFGLSDKEKGARVLAHASDSAYCPDCSSKLAYKKIFFSHLGIWKCTNCGLKRPTLDISDSPIFPLSGTYNKYNSLAAVLLAQLNNINNRTIEQSLRQFKPAFGRQEIIKKGSKNIQIFLSKNPASFNESLRTVYEQGAKTVLLVLNDRIPDGRDVSWIWDVDFENFIDKFKNIILSGDRAYDMGLRIKYSSSSEFQISNFKFQIEENLKKAIQLALEKTPKSETLYILPTYSAMLEVRKILTGRKIL
ncbi:MAG: Mur ligase family protein [Candidatus Levybacteria bacterium]|nr:Mur ligase family protein [Candidatus Levybacteria bacterium]